MEASLRNEPIKMRDKISKRGQKYHFWHFSGLLVLLTALWNQRDILHSFQKRFKNKLAGENAVTRLHCMECARSSFKKRAPGNGYKIHAKNKNIL